MARSSARIVYQTLTPAFVAKATDCVGFSFAQSADPFTKALGLTTTQWGILSHMFIKRAADKNLSVIAVDDGTQRVEGVMVNEDWKDVQPEQYKTLDDWRPVRAIFNELHTRFKATMPHIERGKVFHSLYFTCVRPEARRKGIMHELWRLSDLKAHDLHFQHMVAEASMPEAAQLLHNKLGFKEIAGIPLKDFMFEGKQVFSSNGNAKLSIYLRDIASNLYV